MTLNSTTSKPSTESDTATKKSRWLRLSGQERETSTFDFLDLYWSGPERRITGLTLRIIGVNAAALVMLAVGTLYLGHYQKSLIETKLDTFKTEVELVAAALSEAPASAAPNDLDAQARLVKRLSQTMDQRVYLFNETGALTLDSNDLPALNEPGHLPDEDDEPRKKLYSIEILKQMAGMIIRFLPDGQVLPIYPAEIPQNATDHPDTVDAIKGIISMSAWHDNEGHIFLTAAAPMYKGGKILGAVMLARGGQDIEESIGGVWVNILQIFTVTLLITIILSIYLSGTIAAPLRKLAGAAEALRKGKEVEIPDFSSRRDEIGELSIVMREMTQALWDRMDSIERFAADVAHELKNPLTSLKSAVETAGVVKKEGDRAKLMEIISHDIERMDRLISDISNASRLDAELSREAMERVSIRKVLHHLLENNKSPLERAPTTGSTVIIKASTADAHITLNDMGEEDSIVWGRETRLAQVFENLVSNALSFSPPGGKVHITIVPVRKRVVVTVEDEGPGIPENRLETIFERFYTERPEHEDYGRHSGLGLSICQQIVSALGGQIFAENIKDQNQKVTGARFTVILSRAS